jgi:deazaflavin-dependent oxidoreductase (nitroreductase family)
MMSEYQMGFLNINADQLRGIFKVFNRFMMLLWRLGLGSWGNGTEFGGSLMVIKHTGRKTGLVRHTPVNYAISDGEIYCTAGFGVISDWYRNVMTNPQVEVWLPDERWDGIVEDVTDEENNVHYFRKVLIASGFAGPLFGANPKHLSDQDLERLLENYRLIRIRRVSPVTGPGGPGELSWVWPVATFILLWLLVRKRKR